MRIALSTCLAVLLVGCGGDTTPSAGSGASSGTERAPVAGPEEPQSAVTRSGGRAADDGGDRPPSFAQVGILPGTPTVVDDLTAVAKLGAGSSVYTDINYTWLVNDREVLGWSRDHLPADRGEVRKGDRVRVRATARDEKQREAVMESKDLVIANSTPVILSDLRDARRMNGVRLEASDADPDDQLTWTLREGPPGVTIDTKGRIRVRQVQLDKEWKGEVVFAVADGDGAGAELHIPVAINAAEADRIDEKTEQKRVELEKMDPNKVGEAALKDADDVSKMSDEEFKKYMDEREARGGPQ